MKILSFTTLFPNALQPAHGVFVANRLRRLVATGEAEVRVVAPVPWFPFTGFMAGQYGRYGQIPRVEQVQGLDVIHPRYPVIPKIGMTAAPLLLAFSQIAGLKRIIRDGYNFDILDAHYFYPDGVAAALLGKWLDKPVVITGRGTDLNLIPAYALPRRQIQWAAKKAAAMITVCAALKSSLVDLGVPPEKVSVLRNGVDLKLFTPPAHDAARADARRRFGMDGFAMTSVGQLIERKGNHLIIEALKTLPDVSLYVAGEGPERQKLEKRAADCGVAHRVHFLGLVSHDQLPALYGAADAMVLASSREGWANVLLEAMACGTPVVATRIWGTPEVVTDPVAGVLMPDRSAAGVVAGVQALRQNMPDRAATRLYAEGFSWDDTTQGQLRLFRSILGPSYASAAGVRRSQAYSI